MSAKPPRTLILCFDGTTNHFDGDVSECFSGAGILDADAFLEHERRALLLAIEKR